MATLLRPVAARAIRTATAIDSPPVLGKRAISANTALRLSRYFGMSERFWLNLQAHYTMEVEKDRLGGQLELEIEPLSRPA